MVRFVLNPKQKHPLWVLLGTSFYIYDFDPYVICCGKHDHQHKHKSLTLTSMFMNPDAHIDVYNNF